MDIPYDLIHEIEIKYGTVDIPDDNPLMQKLHQAMGVSARKHHRAKSKPYAFKPHYYDDEVIHLINEGYSINEVADQVGHATVTVSKIARFYHLKTKPKFIYVFDGVYLSSKDNLEYWGIKLWHVQGFNDPRLSIERHRWCDIPSGGRYMIPGNNTEIFTK